MHPAWLAIGQQPCEMAASRASSIVPALVIDLIVVIE
jgi:hypothetical protein